MTLAEVTRLYSVLNCPWGLEQPGPSTDVRLRDVVLSEAILVDLAERVLRDSVDDDRRGSLVAAEALSTANLQRGRVD
jgi:hypothetical protein